MMSTQTVTSFLKSHMFAIVAFLIPLGIRAVPEVIVGPYPVGWDIIAYYIPNSLNLASGGMNVWNFITLPPLMYLFVVPVYVLTNASLVWIFKIMGPILYGFLGWSIFRFCRTRLNWNERKAFFAVLFISAYFVTLRIAWDAYEAELGLALLLLGESIVGSGGSMRLGIARLSLLSLAVLSNQLVGVLVVGTQLASLLRSSTWARSKLASLQILPVALFGLVVYATLQTPLGPGLAVVGSGASLSSLLDTTAFLAYSFVFVVPLLLFGLKLPERSVFTSWVVVCIGGLLLAVLPGHVFQDIGYRWALLLAVPVLIIAYEGYTKLSAMLGLRAKNWSTLLRAAVIVGLASSATLFAVLPAQSAFPLYTVFPQYLPSSMVQSSLPSSDYANVVSAMVWLNGHTSSDSAVITQQAFYGWAREYLSSGRMILNCYLNSPSTMLTQAEPYAHVYTVWWVQGTGWFQGSFPAGAKPVVSFCDLVVYQYR
jgi:hypothetical protein